MCQTVTTTSAYDATVEDLLQQNLYTAGWEIRGNLNNCSGTDTHSTCVQKGTCLDTYFSFTYVQAAEQKHKNYRKVEVSPGGSEESVEVIPSHGSLFGRYWDYFSERVFEGCKGESLVSICRGEVKSPSFDVLGCVIALTHKKPPNNYAWVKEGGSYWVILIPNSVVSNIMDSLNCIDIIPLPSAHDTQSYNSSRVLVKCRPVLCEMRPGDWTKGSTRKSISRFTECDAVATATLTVSILLTPYAKARGKHTSKKYMSFVVHNVK